MDSMLWLIVGCIAVIIALALCAWAEEVLERKEYEAEHRRDGCHE